MRNILLLVQYDGTDFAGWQLQDRQRTVQGTLGEAVRSMVHHPIVLRGSSRTDAGVHARALPVSFETSRTIPVDGFWRGLNATLPLDVAIVEAHEVPLTFRPRDEAVAKTYRYQVQLGPVRLPLLARKSWHVHHDIGDIGLERMCEAARLLLGDHDFSAFRASGCRSKTTRRRLYAVDIERSNDPPLLSITITGNAFLRNMVRIVAGTLVEIGRGRRDVVRVAQALAHGDRCDG